jgi:V/A-type H+/Na+-transporting ATPase subunit D
MNINVAANRMQSLKLKRRLELAKRGHNLLKKKQDQLIQNFTSLIGEIKGLRARAEDALVFALKRFTIAACELSPARQRAIFAVPGVKFTLDVETQRLMNLRVPVFKPSFEGNPLAYSLRETDPEVDFALREIAEILEILLKLAETEKKLYLLADELDRTRRRVNALEYTMIPTLIATIKMISQKLDELERGNLTRLMKVKDMIEEKRRAK